MWLGYRIHRLLGTPYVGYLHQLTTFLHKRPAAAGNWATKGDFLMLDGLLGVFGKTTAKQLDKICHRNADRLLFNSTWTKRLFEREYGVTGDVCYPGTRVMNAMRELARENVIMTASRHYPWKRIDLALHVLKRLRTKPRFVVVGDETLHTPTLKEIAAELGISHNVDFTGFVGDHALFSLYESSGAYVQTSIQEPFGLGPLEAQGSGAPAVVWGDGGVKETVLDGETGFHAKPYNLEDFAAKVDLILSDRERQNAMSRAARAWTSTFSWDAHIDLLEAVLDEHRC
jgi:glycosyltransferase involved in cell wall biosynthesis